MPKNEKELQNQTQIEPNRNVPIIYTNFITANFSPFDFELMLGVHNGASNNILPVANVKMSPQFMKEMVKVLKENIELYEKTYGSGKPVN